MPRKYNPGLEYEFYDRNYREEGGNAPAHPVMKETMNGEWVKLTTFKDEQARLMSQIETLKKQIVKMKELKDESISG
jgi:hypothetical protein